MQRRCSAPCWHGRGCLRAPIGGRFPDLCGMHLRACGRRGLVFIRFFGGGVGNGVAWTAMLANDPWELERLPRVVADIERRFGNAPPVRGTVRRAA